MVAGQTQEEHVTKSGRNLSDEEIFQIADTMISSLPLSVFVMNEEQRIIHMNAWAQRMFGEFKHWENHPVEDLCPPQTEKEVFKRHLDNTVQIPLFLTLQDYRNAPIHARIFTTRLNNRTYIFLQDNPEMASLEDELRNFKIAIHSADDAIYLFDQYGKIFFSNPAFEYQVGLPYSQILGNEVKLFWKTTPEEFDKLWKHISNGNPWAGELVCTRGDRSTYDVELRITPIYNQTKRIVAHICVQRDITRRKEMEKQLEDYSNNLERKVEERTEALSKLHEISQLFHSADTLEKRIQLVLIAATAGETFRFNRAFLLLVDLASHQLLGRAAVGPADPEEAGKIWKTVENIPRDGTIAGAMQAYLSGVEVRDGYVNQIVRRMSTSLDNTQSIIVQALKNDRTYIIENGITTVDFDRNIINLLGTDSFAVVPLLVSKTPIGVLVVDNAITHHTISSEDVTMLEVMAAQAALAIAHADTMEELAKKVKETEMAYSELRRSQQKLVESSKFAALGQMAATVAHEIRTPLVAIGGFANMLLRKRTSDDPDFNYINIIRDEALRLEDVLTRLLFYARPSTPQKEPNDLNALVECIIHFMTNELNYNDIQVELKLSPQLPQIAFDRKLMRQVIINVVQNAIQSMENGGTLSLYTFIQDRDALLEIEDTGVGIAEENLERIFEPFFSTKHAGTGLGLHVSQRIVASHGGKLTIESRKGSGTTVSIRLPLTEGTLQ